MKLLIIGASGVLGSRLYSDAVREKWDVLGTFYSCECDGLFCLRLEDKKSISRLFNFFRPEIIILAGGITDVDLCEARPRLAEKINIKGTIDIVEKAKECDAKLVYLSTDYIFDGKEGPYSEEDAPSPINVYGGTKLEAENIIRGNRKDYLIIRTSQLYGCDRRKKNFAVKVILKMRNNRHIYAADDFYSTPTYTERLSASIIKLIKKGCTGVFNIAGRDFLDRYSYVSKISDVFNLEKSYIKRTTLKGLHLKAKRPPKGGLKIDKAERILDEKVMGLDRGLEIFKEEFLEMRRDI